MRLSFLCGNIIRARLKYALKSWLFVRGAAARFIYPLCAFFCFSSLCFRFSFVFVCCFLFFVPCLCAFVCSSSLCLAFIFFCSSLFLSFVFGVSIFSILVFVLLSLFFVFVRCFLWHSAFLSFCCYFLLLSFACFLVSFFPFVRCFLLCLSLLSYGWYYLITIINNKYISIISFVCAYARTHAHAHDKGAVKYKAQKRSAKNSTPFYLLGIYSKCKSRCGLSSIRLPRLVSRRGASLPRLFQPLKCRPRRHSVCCLRRLIQHPRGAALRL